MSVFTSADECIDGAKRDIDSAINNLSEIVIKKCWGSDEFNTDYEG